MKIPISIIIFLLTSSLLGQVQKIKIKRFDTLICDYKFVAAPEIMNKIYRIDFFKFTSSDKLKKNTTNVIRLNLSLVREKALFINKLYFDSLVRNVCIINKFKLNKIEVKQYGDTEHIMIDFNYKKIKKKN
jgi:hypothetical protein